MTRRLLKFIALSSITLPLIAHALTPVTDIGLIQLIQFDTNTRITAVTSAINAMNSSLSSTLNTRMTTLTSAVDAQSAKTASAIGNAAENANERQLDALQEQAKIKAEEATRTPIDPCANASRGLGSSNLDRVQSALRGGGLAPAGMTTINGQSAGSGPSTGSAKLDKAIAVGENRMAAPSPEAQRATAAEGACSAYAAGSSPGSRGKMCTDGGIPTNGAPTYPNADVRADSVYDGAQTEPNTGKISYTFTKDQVTAARAYLRNVFTSTEPKTLGAAELASDEGKEYIAMHDAYMAQIAMSKKPVEEYLNNVYANKQTIPVLQAMVDGQGASSSYVQSHLPTLAPTWQTDGISFHELMALEADRRTQNPEWVKEIAGATDQLSLMREQIFMQAQANSLATKQLLASEKLAMTLGAIYNGQVNQTMVPKLMAAYNRATGSRKAP